MLNVDFDVLWKRHRRQKRIKRLQVFIASVLLGLVLYVFAIPVQLTVCIKDEKHCLPLPQEAILKVDGAIYPLTNLDTCVVLPLCQVGRNGVMLRFHLELTIIMV